MLELEGKGHMKQRWLAIALTTGAGVGFVASFLEILEYISLIKHPHTALACDLNSVFSCSNVLTKWQSSVFGFPNPVLCLIFFTFMFTLGLVALAGTQLPRIVRAIAHGISLFFLTFGLWYLEQNTFSIGALCILCLFCYGGLIAINASLLRMSDGPIAERATKRGADIFGWLLFAILIAFVMAVKFV
jgi:uncharacterized membrane protein